jgi:hypothetical protein
LGTVVPRIYAILPQSGRGLLLAEMLVNKR